MLLWPARLRSLARPAASQAQKSQSTHPARRAQTRTMASEAGGGGSGDTAQIAVAFKSPDAQQQFERHFKLAEGVDAHVTPLSSPTAAAAAAGWFDAPAFFQHLSSSSSSGSSSSMGGTLLLCPSIASTQEFMRAHTGVLPEGAVLVADQQTRGKGRGGNVWTSPPGCLMFTVLRRARVPGQQAAFINYVVCLAVVRAIRDATCHLLQGGLDVRIKWPNDIYHDGVKVGGALIHTTWAAGTFCVLTGIGLNVSNAQPTTCLDDIIRRQLQAQQQQQGQQVQQQEQKQQQAQPRVCKEQLLAAVLGHLEACFAEFEAGGFEPLKQAYLDAWMHSGQTVELADDVQVAGSSSSSSSSSSGRVVLRIVGLSPHGFLLAVDAGGQEYELTPDGNSLDMMQGLLKRKL